MKKLRIVFMGTPEFAVGILEAILKAGHEVVGVITATDKPAGRGQKIKYSAVKEFALENGLTLLQPPNLKDEQFLLELKELNANLQVVVAFRMLPKAVWGMPELGTFNLHASLLPQYRGAAPINWAIINGETQTGVTTFFIDEKIDTGAMILKKEVDISPNETAGELHDRLMETGAAAVTETLEKIASGTAATTLQRDDSELKTAYKLDRENCKVDWSKSATDIHNLIRGLSPYPAAWCWLTDNQQEMSIKLYESRVVAEAHALPAGTVVTTKKELKIAAADGFIQVLSLQLPGKKKMTAAELLNGFGFSEHAKAS